MTKYTVYSVWKHRASVAPHYYRVDNENGDVEDWRSYRISTNGKPMYRWQRSRLTHRALIERCDLFYWTKNNCGAILVAKNVRFK